MLLKLGMDDDIIKTQIFQNAKFNLSHNDLKL